MTAMWASMSVLMKILWGITLTASLIFIVQTVMTFIGADSGGMDTDLDGDLSGDVPDSALEDPSNLGHTGMNLYTFRNLINFLLGFGWTAIILNSRIKSTFLLVLISVLVGVGLVVAVMYLFKWLSSMQQTGTINLYKSAVDCQGSVYIPIPGHREGEGKVQVTINDSVREYNALTDGDALKTGVQIRIVEVINANTVLVEPMETIII
ncbi:MAG: hypothetical protein IK045_03645 [Bacteroidales bacterium]|nr:hypothetical protein [Bacteroidales bacterium]